MKRLLTISWTAVLATLVAMPAPAQQTRLSAQAQTNAVPFRAQTGRHLTFVCAGDVNSGPHTYGTDFYPDTSPLCAAAAHAGVFTPGKSAAVTIVMKGEAPLLQGSTRNGVRSLSYGAWNATYSFASDGQPGQVDWDTNLTVLAPDYQGAIVVSCPANGDLAADIWGTDVYSDSSSICVAAVHAGAITFAGGGVVNVSRVPKQAGFPSTVRNGVTSRLWADPAWQSYPQPYSVAKGAALADASAGTQTNQFANRNPGVFTAGAPAPTATGTPRTGTIITPDAATATAAPAPTAPVNGVLTSAATTGTATPIAGPTAPAIPASVTTNSTLSSLPPNTGRYRVTIQGLSALQHTKDNRSLDGLYDEIYAAAVAWVWDRQTNVVKTRILARTAEYGDVGAVTIAPRVQAGRAGPKGGIMSGDLVPDGFNPQGPSLPPGSDRFPLLVWEGALAEAVDGLLIVPSIWERDVATAAFDKYKFAWLSTSFSSVRTILAASLQVPLPGLMSLESEIQPSLPILITLSDLTAQVIDRPIGLTPAPLVEQYKDRFVVVTREKLASVPVGGATDLQIRYQEPVDDPILGGAYVLYLRVEHVQ
jgi:hypothetical protein